MSRRTTALRGVYAITPGSADFPAILARTALLLDTGVCAVQYRDKDASASDRLQRACALRDLCRARGVPFIVNDDPELAHASGADGVHLGADDPAPDVARRLLGPDALIGVSCYDDVDLALRLQDAGADYVALGAFHPTTSKQPRTRATPGMLSDARRRLTCPIVAIGGITPENSAPLIAAGADVLAVISAVYGVADPLPVMAAFRRQFDDTPAQEPQPHE